MPVSSCTCLGSSAPSHAQETSSIDYKKVAYVAACAILIISGVLTLLVSHGVEIPGLSALSQLGDPYGGIATGLGFFMLIPLLLPAYKVKPIEPWNFDWSDRVAFQAPPEKPVERAGTNQFHRATIKTMRFDAPTLKEAKADLPFTTIRQWGSTRNDWSAIDADLRENFERGYLDFVLPKKEADQIVAILRMNPETLFALPVNNIVTYSEDTLDYLLFHYWRTIEKGHLPPDSVEVTSLGHLYNARHAKTLCTIRNSPPFHRLGSAFGLLQHEALDPFSFIQPWGPYSTYRANQIVAQEPRFFIKDIGDSPYAFRYIMPAVSGVWLRALDFTQFDAEDLKALFPQTTDGKSHTVNKERFSYLTASQVALIISKKPAPYILDYISPSQLKKIDFSSWGQDQLHFLLKDLKRVPQLSSKQIGQVFEILKQGSREPLEKFLDRIDKSQVSGIDFKNWTVEQLELFLLKDPDPERAPELYQRQIEWIIPVLNAHSKEALAKFKERLQPKRFFSWERTMNKLGIEE